MSPRMRGVNHGIGAASVVLAGALVLAGCSAQDAASFDRSDDSGTSQTAQPGASPTLYELDPADVITSYTVDPIGGDLPDGGTVTVGVHRLEVVGEVMLLELYFTPEVPTDPDTRWSMHELRAGILADFSLMDPANLTQYRPIAGMGPSQGTWGTGDVETTGASGETMLWRRYFAAPPDGVDTLYLQYKIDHPTIEIPVQR